MEKMTYCTHTRVLERPEPASAEKRKPTKFIKAVDKQRVA